MVQKIESSSSGGWPDLYCLKNGKSFWIEVKRPNETARPLQEYMHKQIKAYGGIVYVIDTIAKCKSLIKE